uniref:Uncharacterized protein n=1 Tax=Neolamprologus brichardi TaxID=32507 RepID=A0A3Q4M181_NEOBR
MEFEESGIGEECGWPTQLDVAHVLTLGLEALQHRLPKNDNLKSTIYGGSFYCHHHLI